MPSVRGWHFCINQLNVDNSFSAMALHFHSIFRISHKRELLTANDLAIILATLGLSIYLHVPTIKSVFYTLNSVFHMKAVKFCIIIQKLP